jgi:hypothetical protein
MGEAHVAKPVVMCAVKHGEYGYPDWKFQISNVFLFLLRLSFFFSLDPLQQNCTAYLQSTSEKAVFVAAVDRGEGSPCTAGLLVGNWCLSPPGRPWSTRQLWENLIS